MHHVLSLNIKILEHFNKDLQELTKIPKELIEILINLTNGTLMKDRE